MKMFKSSRVIALVLSVFMLLGMTGCGSSNAPAPASSASLCFDIFGFPLASSSAAIALSTIFFIKLLI